VQYCEAYEGRFGAVEVKIEKAKKEESKKKGAKPYNEIFSYVLNCYCYSNNVVILSKYTVCLNQSTVFDNV